MDIEQELSKQYKEETGHNIFNFNDNLRYSYVVWLAKEIQSLQSELTKVTAERDSLKCCGNCKHKDKHCFVKPCRICKRNLSYKHNNDIDNWESNK